MCACSFLSANTLLKNSWKADCSWEGGLKNKGSAQVGVSNSWVHQRSSNRTVGAQIRVEVCDPWKNKGSLEDYSLYFRKDLWSLGYKREAGCNSCTWWKDSWGASLQRKNSTSQ